MQHNSQVYLFVYRSPFSVLYRRALLDLAYSTVAGVTLFYITRGGIKTHKLRPIYIYEWLGGYLRRFPKSFGPCWFSSIDFSLYTRLITAQRPNTVMSTGWPNNIFPTSSPLSLSLSISEGKLRVWRRAGLKSFVGRPMTSEGREKMGSYYIQVQEQYRTTGFFFFFLFRVKKKRFPGDRHFDNRKSHRVCSTRSI